MSEKKESIWQNWLAVICILCGGFYCGLSYLNAKPVLHQLNIQQSLEVNGLKNPLGITGIDRSYNFSYAHYEGETEMGQYAGTMVIYNINPTIAQKILATNGAYLNTHSPYPSQPICKEIAKEVYCNKNTQNDKWLPISQSLGTSEFVSERKRYDYYITYPIFIKFFYLYDFDLDKIVSDKSFYLDNPENRMETAIIDPVNQKLIMIGYPFM